MRLQDRIVRTCARENIKEISDARKRESVYLRIVPDKNTGLAEARFWYSDKLVGIQKVRNEDLNITNF